jgi:cytochrome c oxidase assembly factor CtaG
MWMPVFGPVEEWRITPLGQCFYLFSMSIVPTVPGGWLVFAEDVVYKHYELADRLWGIDVLTDQQAAGVVMKLMGGFFLWGVIFFVFVRWATREMRADEEARLARQIEASRRRKEAEAEALGDLPERNTITFEEVEAEFAKAPPAAANES